MIFLKTLFIVIEVVCCLMLIGLILLQKSKNEGLGLAFGAGAGEALFGARAGNVLSKATVVLGIVFMASSLVLGVLFAHQDKTLVDKVAADAPPVQQQQSASMLDAPPEGLDLGTPVLDIDPEPAGAEADAGIDPEQEL